MADIYEIKECADEISEQIEDTSISTSRLFFNFDAVFDCYDLSSALESRRIISNVCLTRGTEESIFDEEMNKERWEIAGTNALIDGFKNVLGRFDTIVFSCKGWKFPCFLLFSTKNSQIKLG